MYKKIIFYLITIICCNTSYSEPSNDPRYSHHQPHQQTYLTPEKQSLYNNYQRRLDTLYRIEDAPSHTHTVCLGGGMTFAGLCIYSIYNRDLITGVIGAAGFSVSGLWLLITSVGQSAASHERQKEIAEILASMEKIYKS